MNPITRIALVLGCLSSAVALPGQAAPPGGAPAVGAARAEARARILRVGLPMWLRADRVQEERIVPPVYSNHLPKSLTWETLVGIDGAGRPTPALASRVESSADLRRHVLHLRPNATFHDGSPCDSAAVKRYLESFLVRDEDRFVALCERIAAIGTPDAHTLVLELWEPYYPFPDLALMNPFGIVGGDVRSPDGHPMIGTGPWRVAAFEPMRRTLLERHEGFDGRRPRLERFELVALVGGDRDPVSTWALERGHVDVLIESWRPSIPRQQAAELAGGGEFRLLRRPGSLVAHLQLNSERGAFADRALRELVAASIDRQAIVQAAEHGFGAPCTTMFAPGVAGWPMAGKPVTAPGDASPKDAATGDAASGGVAAGGVTAEAVILSTDPSQAMLAIELQRQLRRVGIDLAITMVTPRELAARSRAGRYDVLIERTWGAPYDPSVTLHGRFRTKGHRAKQWARPELDEWIEASLRLGPGDERTALYARIQAFLDEQRELIPLYVPERIALVGPGVDGVALGELVYAIDLVDLHWR